MRCLRSCSSASIRCDGTRCDVSSVLLPVFDNTALSNPPLLQIPSRSLFAFDGFEERLEIAFAKAFRALALNNFEKERGPVFYRFGKYLKQITFVIAIDQDAQSLQRVQLLIDVTYTIKQRVVIVGRYVQKFDAALLEVRYRFNDVFGCHGDVLHAFAVVKLEIFVHLRFLFTFRRSEE